MNNKNGITLIALIITIIVMLILVAVTISIAVNGGLFGYAGNAAKETEVAKRTEESWANIKDNMTTDELIAKFTLKEVHNWTRNGDTFTCSHCNLEVEMGQIVVYNPDTVITPSTISGTDSGVSSAIIAGDLSAGNFGADGAQQITQEVLTWIVLGIEDQDGNGINETLLITTTEPINETLYINGAAAYNNGPSIMNKVCKDLYSSSTYGQARSMTIEDVNEVLGWTDTRGTYVDASGITHKVNANTKFSDLPAEVKSEIVINGTNTPDGTSLDNYIIDGYYCFSNGNYIMDDENPLSTNNPISERESAIIFGDYTYRYWLASRGVNASVDDGYVSFGPGRVGGGYTFSCFVLYSSDGRESFSPEGLRPVVPLTSSIPTITEGIFDGTTD